MTKVFSRYINFYIYLFIIEKKDVGINDELRCFNICFVLSKIKNNGN